MGMNPVDRLQLSQPERAVAVVAYAIAISAASYWLNGSLFPQVGLGQLWLFTAFVTLLLGEYLV